MVTKILILIFFEIRESNITRGHNYTLVKKQSRLDVKKYSFSQRTINVWNNLSTDCVHSVKEQNISTYKQLCTVNPYLCMYLIVFTVFLYLYIGSLVSFYDNLFIHCIVTRTYIIMHIAQYCANK